MRQSTMTTQFLRALITVALGFLMLLTPFVGLAQDATPAAADVTPAQVAPATGSLQITLTGSTGLGLSGSVAVSDSAGVYQEVWVSEGFGQASNLAAGIATVTQFTGATDYAVDAAPRYIEIPEGGIGYASITNAFLDTDGDGVGDSVDACAAGNDAIDTDLDGIADACDTTPVGDPTPVPTVEPTPTATVAPTATAMTTATPASTPVSSKTNRSVAAAMEPTSNRGCELLSPTKVVETGAYVMYRCSANGVPFKINFYWITGGWKWAHIGSDSPDLAPPAVDSLDWSSTPASGTHLYTYIFLTPGSSVQAWTPATLGLQMTDMGTFWSNVDLTAHKAVGKSDFTLSCSPSEVMPGGQSGATVSCEIRTTTLNWDERAAFTLSLSTPPAGWTVTTKDPLTGSIKNPTGKTVTFTIKQTGATPGATGMVNVTSSLVVAGQTVTGPTGSFTIKGASDQTSVTDIAATASTVGGTTDLSAKVSPAGARGSVAFYINGSTTAAKGTVNYNVSTGEATLTGYAHGLPANSKPYSVRAVFTPSGTHAGSEMTKSDAFFVDVDHGALTLSDMQSELSWSHPYSLSGYTDTGWLQYTVSGTAPKGWTVQVTASDFRHSGGGNSIPAANLAFATASTTPGTGLTTPITSGSLDTNPVVLSGTAQTPPGPYTQRLDLTMNIPGGTLVGIYTSTITVTAAAAP